MRKILLYFAFAVLTMPIAFAQTRQVSGIVVDETGEPVISATVKETNVQNAVTTDSNGRFSIQVKPESKTLEISSLGMKTIIANIQNEMSVTMEYDAIELEGVVSVGYYQKKEGAMTGSVSVVNSKALEQPVANITQMLQGSTAGVIAVSSSGKPSSGASVTIRGQGSINSGTAPLYIIDNIPVSASDFSMLNPNDIESLVILKDATSTALYGSRGSNGVILVQTKRGADGETQISYKGEFGFSQLLNGKLDLMNTQEKLDYEIKLGLLNPALQSDKDIIEKRSKYNFNQLNEVFVTPFMQSHELSVRGGNKKTTFYISGSYFAQDGIIERSDFERFTGNVNLDHQAKNWLKIGTNIAFSKYEDNFPVGRDVSSTFGGDGQNPVNLAIRLNPYEPLKDDNGEYKDDLGTYGSKYNPLKDSQLSAFSQRAYNLRNMTYLEVEPLKDLKFRSSIGFIIKSGKNKQWASPEAGRASGSTNGYAVDGNSLYTQIIQNNQINYTKNISKHTGTLIVGNEIMTEKNENLSVSVYDVQHPYFTEVSQYNKIYTSGWSGGYSEHNMSSFYAIFNYDYDGKYFVDLSIRTDGDSKLATGNQWREFWSAGVQWNLKKESFMQDLSFLSIARIRANMGTQGNANIDNYMAQGSYAFSSYMGNSASLPSNLGYPNLTWEKTTSYGIGTDLAFLSSRLRISFDWYSRTTSDLFLTTPITLTSGLGSRLRNAGKMRNSGIELSIGGDILREMDYFIKVEGNLTLNTNKILKLYENTTQIVSGLTVRKEGESFGQLYATRWAGVNPVNGDPLWYDKDGNLTNTFSDDDAMILEGKNFMPNKTAGLSITAGYKGFNLYAMFTSVWDKYVSNNTLYFIELDNGYYGQQYNHTKDAADFWTKPGDVTKFPRKYSNARQFDSRIIENQSFVRLKNVTLSYDFNQNVLKSFKILNAARLYASVQNLFTITNYRGLDPEINGLEDLGTYPASRTFLFGIELTF